MCPLEEAAPNNNLQDAQAFYLYHILWLVNDRQLYYQQASHTARRLSFKSNIWWVTGCNFQGYVEAAADLSKPSAQTLACQVLTWGDYGDALEPTEVIYKLCHHISGLGVLKLYVPYPLESSTWPPLILSIPPLRCYTGALMWTLAQSQHSLCDPDVKVQTTQNKWPTTPWLLIYLVCIT